MLNFISSTALKNVSSYGLTYFCSKCSRLNVERLPSLSVTPERAMLFTISDRAVDLI